MHLRGAFLSQSDIRIQSHRIGQSLRLSKRFPATLVRYIAVGATSAACEILLFERLYAVVGLPLLVANVIAICAVTTVGFLGQKLFTFRQRGNTALQLRLFALMLALNFCLNNLLVVLLVDLSGLPSLHAKALQLAISFVFNFSFARFLVFRKR